MIQKFETLSFLGRHIRFGKPSRPTDRLTLLPRPVENSEKAILRDSYEYNRYSATLRNRPYIALRNVGKLAGRRGVNERAVYIRITSAHFPLRLEYFGRLRRCGRSRPIHRSRTTPRS